MVFVKLLVIELVVVIASVNSYFQLSIIQHCNASFSTCCIV